MDGQMQDQLRKWRQHSFAQVRDALERGPPILASWDQARNRYSYSTIRGDRVTIPTSAGIYVFFSAKTDKAVYVGQAENLRRRLGQHCRVSGTSVFKKRWVRAWIGAQATEKDVVRFIHSHMYLKYMVLPFGRCEMESDLIELWGLDGPAVIKPEEF